MKRQISLGFLIIASLSLTFTNLLVSYATSGSPQNPITLKLDNQCKTPNPEIAHWRIDTVDGDNSAVCWVDGESYYGQGDHALLEMENPVSLDNFKATLKFEYQLDLNPGETGDYLLIYINDTFLDQLDYQDEASTWTLKSYDLSAFLGQDIILKFIWMSDEDSDVGPGIALDDIKIINYSEELCDWDDAETICEEDFTTLDPDWQTYWIEGSSSFDIVEFTFHSYPSCGSFYRVNGSASFPSRGWLCSPDSIPDSPDELKCFSDADWRIEYWTRFDYQIPYQDCDIYYSTDEQDPNYGDYIFIYSHDSDPHDNTWRFYSLTPISYPNIPQYLFIGFYWYSYREGAIGYSWFLDDFVLKFRYHIGSYLINDPMDDLDDWTTYNTIIQGESIGIIKVLFK